MRERLIKYTQLILNIFTSVLMTYFEVFQVLVVNYLLRNSPYLSYPLGFFNCQLSASLHISSIPLVALKPISSSASLGLA